ncbi:MAG: hypothetical protein AVDCRST_MAG61-1271 [uncultured Friedmanniella sp.]|uniref:Uncharacterized protein n=1 Tax=uncultured Friedmanniella sp. TaxID=335381 RepID=A0A6J4KHT4_9ACTN|nr:glycosyltransferase family 2 protein [uncultured Friedmanniella sp.]CAA9304998.1 MAG: hypothetical protein AVDCRST_MAG61-1271 [uncultured Friedmanniella sp.]
MAPTQLKVSVIVPVYNPGQAIDGCIRSVLDQTMPADEFEAIFVDDGSTDGSSDRLQALASEHRHLRVIRIPNSGWPGKPRNVGLDAALGEYVMFLDQDDALPPRSLARQYGLGSAGGADVVLGKVTSDFRPVNHDLYRRTRESCTVFDAELMQSLTPHKMLRTAFLREQGIRYPEGPRRLEDQLFMTKAYFAARSASIVGDYVCYRYQERPDGRNAGSKQIQPAGYFENLREVLDIVDAHTGPGPQRDHFYRRFLRTEMLGRLGGKKLRVPRPEYYRDLLSEIRRLMEERFPASVDAGLGAVLRVRSALVRHAQLADIEEYARTVDQLRLDVSLARRRGRKGGALTVDVEARLMLGDLPLALEEAADGRWRLPASLGHPEVPEKDWVLEPLEEMPGDVVVRHRELRDLWFLPGPLRAEVRHVDGHAELTWSGRCVLEPATAAGGEPLSEGLHDLSVRVRALGLVLSRRLPAADPAGLPLLVDRRGRSTQPYATDQGNLTVRVPAGRSALKRALARADVEVLPRGVRLEVAARWAVSPSDVALTLTPEAGGTAVTWPATAVRSAGTAWVAGPSRRTARIAPGPYRLTVTLEHGPTRRRRPLSQDLDAALLVSTGTAQRWWLTALRSSGVQVARRARRRVARALSRS